MPKGRFVFAAILAVGCGAGDSTMQTPTPTVPAVLAVSSKDFVDDSTPMTEIETDHHRHPLCYSVQSLGTLGGAGSSASGINARGEVIGVSDTATSEEHAFLWSCGDLHDLGTLGGPSSVPKAINNHGVVVGSSMLADGTTHAFLWRHGFMSDLGTLPERPNSTAVSVNDRGQVVGNAGIDQAFIWEHGRMRRLPPLAGGQAQAVFITASGRIFGLSNGFDQDFYSAVQWHHDRVRVLVPHTVIYGASNRGIVCDPNVAWIDGQLFQVPPFPFGINDRGQVVGDEGEAFLWDDGDVTDLGSGSAHLINNREEVVVGDGVWFRGVITPLPPPAGSATTREVPTAINDEGEVVGYVVDSDDPTATRTAVLWRPSRCGHRR